MPIVRSLSARVAVAGAAVAALAVGSVAVAVSGRAGAARTGYVQSASGVGDGTSTTVRFAQSTVSGSTLVLCIGANVALDAVTDDAGTVYALVTTIANSSGAGTLSVYEAPRATAPVSSLVVRHAFGHVDAVVAEYTGVRSAHDRVAARDAGYDTGAAWSSGVTARTRRAGEVVVGCAFDVYGSAAPATFSPGETFAARSATRGLFLEDRVTTRAGRFEATGLRAPAAQRNVVAAVVTYPTGRGVPPVDPPTTTTVAPSATTTVAPTTTTVAAPTTTSVAPTTLAPTTTVGPTTTTTLAPATTSTTAAPPSPGGPVQLLFSDVTSGRTTGGPGGLGVPIALYGKGFGAARGTSKVTIGGVEVARYVSWGSHNAHNTELDMIVVQPGAAVSGGAVVVTVGGVASTGAVTFASDAASAIFEVSAGGSDAASCTWGDPCATIGHTVARMGPGDVALVRGGESNESEVWIRGDQGMSGAAGRQKVVKAAPGEQVVLSNAARPFIVDADYITIAGIVFRNGKSLGVPDIGLPGHRGARFVDNAFAGLIAWSAVDLHGDDHLLAGNVCEVTGSTVGTQGHCYYVSYGTGSQLRYNVGAGAPGYGIHVFDQQRSSNDFKREIRSLLIEGNVLRGSTERSGLIIAMGDEGGRGNIVDGIIVRGNTFTGNNHLGAVLVDKVRNVTFEQNMFDENGRQGLYVAAGVTGVTVTGNTFVQTANAVCTIFCTWYQVAHIEIAAGASATVRDNTYRPAPPIVLGATDPSPH